MSWSTGLTFTSYLTLSHGLTLTWHLTLMMLVAVAMGDMDARREQSKLDTSLVISPRHRSLRAADKSGQIADVTKKEGSSLGEGVNFAEREDDPSFVNRQRFVSVYKGKMAVLPCSVKHLGERQVAWRRIETDEFLTIGKMVWTKDPRIVLERNNRHHGDVTSWDILMRNVTAQDGGYYECQITTAASLVWRLQLIVLEPADEKYSSRSEGKIEKFPSSSDTQYNDHAPTGKTKLESRVTADTPIRLTCNTSFGHASLGHAPQTARLTWLKDGSPVIESDHVIITKYQFQENRMYVSELVIDHAHISDSGDYLCRAGEMEILEARIYVLPDSKIGGAKREDRSPYSDPEKNSLQQPNCSRDSTASSLTVLAACLCAMILLQIRYDPRHFKCECD